MKKTTEPALMQMIATVLRLEPVEGTTGVGVGSIAGEIGMDGSASQVWIGVQVLFLQQGVEEGQPLSLVVSLLVQVVSGSRVHLLATLHVIEPVLPKQQLKSFEPMHYIPPASQEIPSQVSDATHTLF
jgi:hypothetical protein